ncbi:MAG: DUF1501 domain-containing protein [Curvibacter sp.]|nr:MAG: DUF1501 domain-containing protein [Curvibacter sp.]
MPDNKHATHSRRTWLQNMLGLSSVWAVPGLWAQTQQAGLTDARLVVVFLRGAYDGLSALVPHGDANYYRLRSNIAIPKPDGTDQSALRLDAMFGLHPAMASVLPLWQQGVLAALPCAGSPDPTRSHFDAQRHWEMGLPGQSGSADGWMNKLAVQHGETYPTRGSEKTVAIGVGEANPLILAGSAPVHRVPKGQAATRQGAIGDARTRDALMKLYAGQDKVSEAFRAGAESRMQTAETLRSDMADSGMQTSEMQAANNGAGNAKGLLLDAQHLGVLMRQDPRLRLGFLSAGGWDTHANQGGVTGALAQNLGNLATALVQLRRDFSQPHDVVVVCSEFGRTSAENGTRGTDHGHGNTLWIMGSQVQGGRWHGRWDGLANGNLHEGRDLPVHHDFRAVLAQVLRKSQGVGNAQLDQLFPGFAWDTYLDSMLRT